LLTKQEALPPEKWRKDITMGIFDSIAEKFSNPGRAVSDVMFPGNPERRARVEALINEVNGLNESLQSRVEEFNEAVPRLNTLTVGNAILLGIVPKDTPMDEESARAIASADPVQIDDNVGIKAFNQFPFVAAMGIVGAAFVGISSALNGAEERDLLESKIAEADDIRSRVQADLDDVNGRFEAAERRIEQETEVIQAIVRAYSKEIPELASSSIQDETVHEQAKRIPEEFPEVVEMLHTITKFRREDPSRDISLLIETLELDETETLRAARVWDRMRKSLDRISQGHRLAATAG
jgi:hypothetical protein